MKTIPLMHYISTHPEYSNIVIMDEGDRTPIQAIERLSAGYEYEQYNDWKINGSLEKGILLVYLTTDHPSPIDADYQAVIDYLNTGRLGER